MAKQKFRGIVPALIILLALGFIILRLTYKPSSPSREGVKKVIGTKLGEAFSNYLPEKSNVIIFTSEGDDFYVEGLKKGLSAKKITINVVSTSRIETESESDYEDKLLKFYNQQLSDNPDVFGIIFLSQFPLFPNTPSPSLPLPQGERIRGEGDGGGVSPKIALLSGMSPKLTRLISQGYVDVVVAGTPEVHIIKKGEEKSPEELFQERFMIVTQDNLEAIIRKYPQYSPERR